MRPFSVLLMLFYLAPLMADQIALFQQRNLRQLRQRFQRQLDIRQPVSIKGLLAGLLQQGVQTLQLK